ncbi:hypothetical protein [Flavobacterium sp. W20_MBD1_R3]|uniref:hypothetical protein n=1 Tax=Flavobacterium sp. W20_MBD1_R3 TaxID=3240278 RepID=UPI003F91E0F7
MESELKTLILKVDKLMEIQELILKRLNQSTILTKEPLVNIITLTKKEEKDKQIQENMLIILNGHRLKGQFNLVQKPSPEKILAYLQTNDPKIFDGMKRKEN